MCSRAVWLVVSSKRGQSAEPSLSTTGLRGIRTFHFKWRKTSLPQYVLASCTHGASALFQPACRLYQKRKQKWYWPTSSRLPVQPCCYQQPRWSFTLSCAYVARTEGFPVSALIPVRIMAGTRKRLYVSPILAPLHRLPVKSRIKLQILLITWKLPRPTLSWWPYSTASPSRDALVASPPVAWFWWRFFLTVAQMLAQRGSCDCCGFLCLLCIVVGSLSYSINHLEVLVLVL